MEKKERDKPIVVYNEALMIKPQKEDPEDDREPMLMYEVSYRLIKDSTLNIEVDEEAELFDVLSEELARHVVHLEDFDLIITKKERI